MKGHTDIHKFTMKEMKTFRTLGEVFNLIQLKLDDNDKLYYNNHIGLEEVPRHAQFQIRDLIVKNSKGIKFRIVMEPSY